MVTVWVEIYVKRKKLAEKMILKSVYLNNNCIFLTHASQFLWNFRTCYYLNPTGSQMSCSFVAIAWHVGKLRLWRTLTFFIHFHSKLEWIHICRNKGLLSTVNLYVICIVIATKSQQRMPFGNKLISVYAHQYFSYLFQSFSWIKNSHAMHIRGNFLVIIDHLVSYQQ